MIGIPVFNLEGAYDYAAMSDNMQQFRKELMLHVNKPERQVLCDIFETLDGCQVYLYNDYDNIEWDEETKLVCIDSYQVDPWTTPILTNEDLSCYEVDTWTVDPWTTPILTNEDLSCMVDMNW